MLQLLWCSRDLRQRRMSLTGPLRPLSRAARYWHPVTHGILSPWRHHARIRGRVRHPDSHLARLAWLLPWLTLLKTWLALLLLLLPLHLLLTTWGNHHALWSRLLPLHHLLLLNLLLLSLCHHLLGVPHLLLPLYLLEEEVPLAWFHVVKHFPLLVSKGDGLLHHLLLRVGQK